MRENRTSGSVRGAPGNRRPYRSNKALLEDGFLILPTEFGSCCNDLADAISQPPNSLFRVDDGVLYLTVGYIETEEGVGWFEQAVLFCPFCGMRLQTREEISRRSS
jgi:hypothetical protein